MNRSTLARRYAPLAAVLAVQLLIIATVPSKAPDAGQELTAGGGAVAGAAGDVTGGDAAGEEFVEGDTGAVDAAGNPVSGGSTGGGTTASGGGAAGSGTAAGTGGGEAGGGASGGATEGGLTGDTSHCVEGRQFDPNVWYHAPKCVPKWAGGNNGGATYQGVTDKEVKVIRFIGKPNPAVDAILTSLGGNPSDAQEEAFRAAAEKYINEKYQFYGRKLVIKTYKGQCDTVPPDYVCLRNEARDMVAKEKPFAVIWNTTLASPFFDELSALKVVNLGGWHFRQQFSQQRRPYHWDIHADGGTLTKLIGEWWCKQMHGKKARYAGETGTDRTRQNPPNNDIRNKIRRLGVISTDDPENKAAITDLKRELAKCGAKVEHEFYYAQDIARADEQRVLGVQKMREEPESTSVMLFGDAVAPVFLYRTCQEQGYFPEHLVVGTGAMDTDAAAQAYDGELNPGGHQFENAFGISSQAAIEHTSAHDASRIWQAAGNQGASPHASLYGIGQYYMTIANLVQGAGPNLTPANLEKGAVAAGPRGLADEIAGHPKKLYINGRGFAAGDYAAIDDVRIVYWSTQQKSEYNGETGKYIPLHDGRRFRPGEIPEGEFTMPEKPR